jgi:putative transposase
LNPPSRTSLAGLSAIECFATTDALWRPTSDDALHCLTDRFHAHGPSEHIQSDHGPWFVARHVRNRRGGIGAKARDIEGGPQWDDGHCMSFNSMLRDDLRS